MVLPSESIAFRHKMNLLTMQNCTKITGTHLLSMFIYKICRWGYAQILSIENSLIFEGVCIQWNFIQDFGGEGIC